MSVLDRTPVDLLDMRPADGLLHLSLWLYDCDHHVDTRRPGGLPAPPFRLDAAWIVARIGAEALAALDVRDSDPVKPDYQPGDEVVLWPEPAAVMGQLAHQEWFERA